MLESGIILNDRYEIIEEIGSGGMSYVYKAKCHKLNRYVAIKVLKDEFRLDESFVTKFKVEAQSAASLSHHNIVNIYDVGHDKNVYYIVMEYIEGITLKDYILQKGHLSSKETIDLSIQIASGILHAHKNHIIHRDIKPQNILMSEGGIAKVTDFGIARAASTANSATIAATATNVVGSVHYISPEQAKGSYIDEKSDLYSLGVTMYEMVTGKVPFEADSNLSVALLHIQEQIKKPSLIRPEIRPSLEAIILKATAKRPELRYASMSELIIDLEKALESSNGDFVKTNQVAEAHTVLISDEEVKQIKRASFDDYEEEPVEKKKKEKDKDKNLSPLLEKLIVTSGVFLAIFLVSVVTFFAVKIVRDRYIPKEVAVPSLVGLTLEEATTLLEDENLFLNVLRQEYSEDYSEGLVMDQAPQSELLIEEESKVNVIVSKGVETFKVPSVTNLNYLDAEKIIKENNLSVERTMEYNEIVPTGIVIRQFPDDGELLRKGEKVTIVASNGKEPKYSIVPDLKGLTESQARQKVNDARLTLSENITYVESQQYAEGEVISQTVEYGREVEEGYEIGIVVSLGYTPVYEVTKVISDVLPEGKDEAIVRLELKKDDEVTVVYEKAIERSEFPISVTMSGTEGQGEIYLYINDEQQGDPWPITFSEEAN